jgi:hypothetical protein
METSLYDMLFAGPSTEGKVVAVDAAPLQAIKAVMDNQFEAECVVDNGSGIVAASRAVWERLGQPARTDMILKMESSHGTIERTIGVLPNFPVVIGNSTFYVQLQISENLPCDVLLGRPFWMMTAASTKDSPDGSQVITMVNPNTGEEITVPTQERNKKRRPQGGFH